MRIVKLFCTAALLFLITGAASAENVTTWQNFNSTIGMGPSPGGVAVRNLTTNEYGYGVANWQPVYQIYNAPWMPADIFWTFFYLGIGLLIFSRLMKSNVDVELITAVLALIFITIDYTAMPFIANINTVAFQVVNTTANITMMESIVNIQPYALVYSVDRLTLVFQAFFWTALLNFFIALWHLIDALIHPEEFLLSSEDVDRK